MSTNSESTNVTDASDSTDSTQTPRVRMHLHRSQSHRLLAGVAGGIAERFDVNENLVRAVFMALSLLWGLGLALYLVLWAVLPLAVVEGAIPVPRERAPRSTSHRLTVSTVAALVVFVTMVAVLLRHPVRLLVPGLGATWLIFLAVLAVIALRTPARRVTLRRVGALVFLAWLSVMIIFVGAATGFLESSGVSLTGGIGDRLWQPASLGNVKMNYRVEFGVGTLDLSNVTFPISGAHISVSVAAGALRLVLPADAVVDLTTNVGAGRVLSTPQVVGGRMMLPYFSGEIAGGSATQRRPHVTIDARVGAGIIDLMRGP